MSKVHSLLRDREGVTVVEFALICPVLLSLMMGIYDLAYLLYVDSTLQGSIQKAGRNSTIEGATEASQNAVVENTVRTVAPTATFVFKRMSYAGFSSMGTPEDFVDVGSPGNGTCDSGETYVDTNGNGTWDADRGKSGMGGARDAVLYTVTVTYPRPFPLASMMGFSDTVTLKTETVLRNQPYTLQSTSTTTRTC